MNAETRQKISITRKRLFAEGKLRCQNAKRADVPNVQVVPAYGYWLSGFVDGEACFFVREKSNGGIETRFLLTLRADDASVLRELHETLGFGSLRYGQTKTTKIVKYSVTSYAECLALVRIFRRYPLRSKKRVDFEAWAEIVEAAFKGYKTQFSLFKKQVATMQAVKHVIETA